MTTVETLAFLLLGLGLGAVATLCIGPALSGMRGASAIGSVLWTFVFGGLMVTPIILTRFFEALPYAGRGVRTHPVMFIFLWFTPVAVRIGAAVFSACFGSNRSTKGG